jgi:tRNA(fMet)-specific endonuclease VapC
VRVLDTDVCVELLRGNAAVIERRSGIDAPVATTWMTAAELYYGAERSAAPTKNRRLVARLLETLPVLETTERAARQFGAVRAVLERLGQRLGDAELIIASVCLAHDGVLVTGNLRHFGRVPGLQVETWMRVG